ncbi:MAG: hypothetical protein B7Z54_09325 [Sphingobacteriales bacterium 12-47-4]|nr:MAG: hypothetical protein B7Z54_09325 [Sphingobacteriales bacterium 12-47-4]
MKRSLLCSLLLAITLIGFAQKTEPTQEEPWKKEYRETATRINDLIHTKLEVKPDFSKSYLY